MEVVSACGVIGWFMTQLFAKDPKLKKMLKWLFGSMFVGAALAALWPSDDAIKVVNNHQQTATTTGNNSPAMSASTTGGNSPLYQSAGGITVNNGISEATLLALLRDKSIAANLELSHKYPLGYVLVGVGNGKVVYLPETNGCCSITADWDNAEFSIDRALHLVNFRFPKLEISTTNAIAHGIGFGPMSGSLGISYLENQPTAFQIGNDTVRIYAVLLDAERNIFVIGFK